LHLARAAPIIAASMRLAASLLVIACVWLAGHPARVRALEIEWHGPPSCPDASSVRGSIAAALDAGATTGVKVVRAHVVAVEGGYRLELTLETALATHRKQLEATHCSTFVDLLALELSFSGVPKPAPAPIVETPVPMRWGVRAAGFVGTSPTPAPAPGAALGLTLQRKHLRIELVGIYATPRVQRYAEQKPAGGRFQLGGVEVRGCYLPSFRRRLALPLCAGAALGVLHGKGLGVPEPFTASRLWAALLVAPALEVPIAGPLSLWFELAGSLALKRPAFALLNLPILYRPPLWGVRGAAGLALVFN
jgi:hypothetical protein